MAPHSFHMAFVRTRHSSVAIASPNACTSPELSGWSVSIPKPQRQVVGRRFVRSESVLTGTSSVKARCMHGVGMPRVPPLPSRLPM